LHLGASGVASASLTIHLEKGLAAFIEVLSEPLYIFTLRFLLYRPRVVIEGTASFFRCITTFLLVYCYPSLGIVDITDIYDLGVNHEYENQTGALAFSFSWLVYSFIIFSGYYAYFFYRILNNPCPEGRLEERKNAHTGPSDINLSFPLRSVRELFPRPSTSGSVP